MNTIAWPTWMGKIPRQNSPWNDQEEAELVRAFRCGVSLKALARKHGRAEGGIESRLMRVIGENFYSHQYQSEIMALQQEVNRLSAKTDRLLQSMQNRYGVK